MKIKKMKFNITRHCRDRYIERVLANSGKCDNLFITMLSDLKTGENITSKISENLPRFVLYLKERYGKDKGYTIIKKDYTFFILTKRKGTEDLYDVITCYIEYDTFRRFSKTILSKDQIHLKLALL